MKRAAALIAALMLVLSGCSAGSAPSAPPESSGPPQTEAPSASPTQGEAQSQAPIQSGNVLIAYFTVPEDVETDGVDAVAGASIVVSEGEKLGNTEYVARLIQQTVGGELFRSETVQPYPLDHDPLVDQASEEKAASARPELSAHVENMDQYDTILLGYPNWWGDLPMPLYTFLEEYDLAGKTIIPFITHGGSRASRTVETIAGLQTDAQVWDDPLVLSRNDVASSADQVTSWAEGLGLTNQ